MTALHLLAGCSAVDLVAGVAALGVDINAVDHSSETALFHGLGAGNFDKLAALFASAGGDLDHVNVRGVS